MIGIYLHKINSGFKMIKKIFYLLSQRYNPYPLYFFDLLTERHLKNRVGDCIDCINCCQYVCGCYCSNVDLELKRCKIYDNRKCDEWFPVSQKEIDYMAEVKPGFKCRYSFK